MKTKISITLLLLFLNISSSSAQKFLGIRAGINLSNYNTSNNISTSINKTSEVLLTFGIPFETYISPNFSIQPELTFIQKGYGSNFTTTASGGVGIFFDEKLTTNWFEIPVMIKYKFFNIHKTGFALMAGPSLAYAFSGKIKSTTTSNRNGTISIYRVDEALDFKNDEHRRTDLAVNFGSELTMSSIFLDVRFQLGLTNLNTNSTNNEKAMTRGLMLTAGYRFSLCGN